MQNGNKRVPAKFLTLFLSYSLQYILKRGVALVKRNKIWFRAVVWVMIISMALSTLLFALEFAIH
jgi:hypothetical protein